MNKRDFTEQGLAASGKEQMDRTDTSLSMVYKLAERWGGWEKFPRYNDMEWFVIETHVMVPLKFASERGFSAVQSTV